MDDIKGENPASESVSVGATGAPSPSRRSVGAESETRGGHEAPETSLSDEPAAPPFEPPDGFPGERAALPAGSLSNPYLGPQGDENRTPAPNAPSDVRTGSTVEELARDRDRG
jgi:hypothetical protein